MHDTYESITSDESTRIQSLRELNTWLKRTVEAQTFRRLTITDSETIEQIVAALDTVLPLGPRARMPMPYVLQFHLEDGNMKSLGYASGGENPAILRCDQLRCFDEQDAEPPAEFGALIGELLAAETEGP